jgi:hypothetical protein
MLNRLWIQWPNVAYAWGTQAWYHVQVHRTSAVFIVLILHLNQQQLFMIISFSPRFL